MTPSTTIVKTIYRGLYWDGVELTCRKRDKSASNLTGCTSTAKMKKGSGASVTVPTTIASNKILIGPLNEASTAALENGRYELDLVLLWPDTKKRGIYAKCALLVETPISI